MLIDIDRCGPEGPAAGAKRLHAAEGPGGVSVARSLYLKLLTRQTIKPGARQAKMPHMRQIEFHDQTDVIPTTRQAKVAHIRRHENHM